jgi:hypothetical protein
MIMMLLSAHKQLRGVLFDLPHVACGHVARLEGAAAVDYQHRFEAAQLHALVAINAVLASTAVHVCIDRSHY